MGQFTPHDCFASVTSKPPLRVTCATSAGSLEVSYLAYYEPPFGHWAPYLIVHVPIGRDLWFTPRLSELPVPAGARCQLTVQDNVVDLQGRSVPADQRVFDFQMQDLAFLHVEPAELRRADPPTQDVVLLFNAALDDASFDPNEVGLTDAAGDAVPYRAFPVNIRAQRNHDAIRVGPTDTLQPGTYSVQLHAGASLTALHGGTVMFPSEVSSSFTVP